MAVSVMMNDDNEHQNAVIVDVKLLAAWKRFQRAAGDDESAEGRRILWMHHVHFNRSTLLRLAAFLDTGRNGHCCPPVQQLSLSTCRFDDAEAQQLFCNLLANNDTLPKTLKKLHLERCLGLDERRLLDSFHHNTTIQVLSLFGSSSSSTAIQGAAGGAMVAALLQSQNAALTTMDLGWAFEDIDFVRALREGILAASEAAAEGTSATTTCCCHLHGIALHRSNCMEQGTSTSFFDKLQLVFVKNKQNTGQETTTTTCRVNLCHSFDPNATATLTQLRRLLLTMPGLVDLNVTDNWLQIAPCALFQQQQQVPRLQLQKLNLTNCAIDHNSLAQMAEAAAAAAAATALDESENNSSRSILLELNLSRNKIAGRRGGSSLGCFLMESRRRTAGSSKLHTLILSGNGALGVIGARALAPALVGQHRTFLQRLNLSSCRIQDGAIAILTVLTSSTTTTTTGPCSPCLRSLDLSDNLLPATVLVAVAEYLQQASSRHLQELYLSKNFNLFKSCNTGDSSTNNSNDTACSFFDALAKHPAMQILHVSNVGMNEQQTERPLLWALLHNTILLHVEHSMTSSSTRIRTITMEYMRRNHLFANMKRTMDKPIHIPCAVWPVALHVCSPRRAVRQEEIIVGPTLAFCLVQKMMECSVFRHTAAVYRFEKVRACIRVQRWWKSKASI
jgi:Leucine Rich repeat